MVLVNPEIMISREYNYDKNVSAKVNRMDSIDFHFYCNCISYINV